MKKFFSVVPLQPKGFLKSVHYVAEGNSKLDMEGETCFPIMTAINGYAEPGEEFRVIAVQTESDAVRHNGQVMREELDSLCNRKGLNCPHGVEMISIETDERVSAHVDTFQKLLDYVDDDDELFVCMTYGTKPLSTALMMAMQYAYRIKDNASISCIVYGLMDRNVAPNVHKVYDMTALIQLDEIVRILAERGVTNPKEVIHGILEL